jgi:hypothetical protein
VRSAEQAVPPERAPLPADMTALRGRADARPGEPRGLPFRDGAFDVAFVVEVADLPDPGLLFQELNRVLQPGGLVLAATRNASCLSPIAVPPAGGRTEVWTYSRLRALLATYFPTVRMVGQSPFLGYTFVEYDPRATPDVRLDTTQIVPASRMVSQTTGFVVQPNKAVVGANAFAHASGIHQDGVLKARDTYEIMRAEDVGWSANKIVLGKLSGRNAFKQRLEELGIEMQSESDINVAFAKFKELADRKAEIFDEDIIALVSDESVTPEKEQYGLVSLSQHSETGERPRAKVVFTIDGKEYAGESDGNGPVDASLKAIETHVKSGAEMLLYSVNAITSGSTESQGEVTVRLQHGGRIVNGVGADPDIVVASAKAYLSALTKLHSKADRGAAQG